MLRCCQLSWASRRDHSSAPPRQLPLCNTHQLCPAPNFACSKAVYRKPWALPQAKLPHGSRMRPRCGQVSAQCHAAAGKVVQPPGGVREPLRYSGPCNGTLTAGTGRTQPGAFRLAPANTFRKYGFLINRVKRENFPTGLPRVRVSPGERAPSCQDWLCLPVPLAPARTQPQRVEQGHLLPTRRSPPCLLQGCTI